MNIQETFTWHQKSREILRSKLQDMNNSVKPPRSYMKIKPATIIESIADAGTLLCESLAEVEVLLVPRLF